MEIAIRVVIWLALCVGFALVMSVVPKADSWAFGSALLGLVWGAVTIQLVVVPGLRKRWK